MSAIEKARAEFGDPRLPPRFWAKVCVDQDTGCWRWTASTRGGYGQFSTGTSRAQRIQPSHVVAYEALVGPTPEGKELDHVRARGCLYRDCSNPAHIEAVTHAENWRRGDSSKVTRARHAARTHCLRGHAFDEANTHMAMYRGRSVRICRACKRGVRARQRQKAAP